MKAVMPKPPSRRQSSPPYRSGWSPRAARQLEFIVAALPADRSRRRCVGIDILACLGRTRGPRLADKEAPHLVVAPSLGLQGGEQILDLIVAARLVAQRENLLLQPFEC